MKHSFFGVRGWKRIRSPRPLHRAIVFRHTTAAQ